MGFLSNLNQWSDWGLLVLRIAVGLIFLSHGFQKLALWKAQPSQNLSAGMLAILKLLSIAEPLGGLAVLGGFLARLAAVGLGMIMIGAIVLHVRRGDPFSGQRQAGWEFAFILLAATIALLFFGGGSLAVDRVLFGI